jgi:hypothetical protein
MVFFCNAVKSIRENSAVSITATLHIFSWSRGAYRKGKMGMLYLYWGRFCIIKLTQPPDNMDRKLEDTLIKNKIKFSSYIWRLRGIGCKVIYG